MLATASGQVIVTGKHYVFAVYQLHVDSRNRFKFNVFFVFIYQHNSMKHEMLLSTGSIVVQAINVFQVAIIR